MNLKQLLLVLGSKPGKANVELSDNADKQSGMSSHSAIATDSWKHQLLVLDRRGVSTVQASVVVNAEYICFLCSCSNLQECMYVALTFEEAL